MSTGEAVHPAVHQRVPGINWGIKYQLSMSHTACDGPGGTLGAHTFTCETWHSLLQVTSPATGGLACADS